MPRWTEPELRGVVAESDSLAEVLRRFELRAAGGNFKLLRGWLERWEIPTDHFTYGAKHPRIGRRRRPIEEYLVEGATIRRDQLKLRLYDEGVKRRRCEICGQGEVWNGGRMSLILDHVNGVHDDNRIHNLRIVCPNCNATLPTHCGKNHRPVARPPRPCPRCAEPFWPVRASQTYCSRRCWQLARQRPRPEIRRVERPPYEQLLEEIETSSWSAVGRNYGVSCNAVRKWVQAYQRQAVDASEAGKGERRGAA